MTDTRIKLVYNWIGPNGPIWNTEVPSVLSLADAAIGSEMTSTRVWTDDTYGKMFKDNEDFILSPSCALKKEDFYVFPFSLSWRVNFENYFAIKEGILEFCHSDHLVNKYVKYGNGYFLIDHAMESFVQDHHLHKMHSYFTATNIPLNKVIYLTGCMNVDEVYTNFLDKYNLDKNKKMNILAYPTFQTNMHRIVCRHTEEVYDVNHLPEKLFLSWNRRFRPHRIKFLLGLEKLNLVERSHISIGKVDPEQPHISFVTAAEHLSEEQLIEKFARRLPLELDKETELMEMCVDLNGKTNMFYETSLLSIIGETNYEQHEVSLTEKTFKPIAHKHPFIMLGSAISIRSLHKLGFKTFSQWWSEDYDDMQNPDERLAEILRVCEYIGTWSSEKILQFKQESKAVLDHNYELMKTDVAVTIADRIKEVILK